MDVHVLSTVVAYGFALVFSLLFAGLIAAVLWRERSQPSTIVLTAAGTAAGSMTLAITVLDHFLR